VKADWDVLGVSFSPSGRYRVSTVNADGLWEVTFLDTATGKPVALTGVPDGEVTQVCFNADETRVAFGVNTDTSPRNSVGAEIKSPNRAVNLLARSNADMFVNQRVKISENGIRQPARDWPSSAPG